MALPDVEIALRDYIFLTDGTRTPADIRSGGERFSHGGTHPMISLKDRLGRRLSRLIGQARRFGAAEGGAIAIIMAMSLPVVVGFVGLGVEVGLWFHAKRGLQAAADAAALSGAYERLAGNADSVAVSSAQQAAAVNGYNGGLDDTIDVNVPPESGEFTGDSDAVEVLISREMRLLFSGLILDDNVRIDAYAVAILTPGDDAFCVLALDPSTGGAVSIGGTANVTLDCGIAANSNAVDAVEIFGSADVLAGNVQTAGGITVDGSGELTTVSGEKENAPKVKDPYAAIPEPTDDECDHNTEVKVQNNDVTTLQPGVYCGGIRISGGTADFAPGTYILRGGDLVINGGVTTGDDVFFYLTEEDGTYAEVDIAGNADVTLEADPDGDAVGVDHTGMLFMQDDDATGTSSKFNGGSDMSLAGVVYFPNQPVDFLGGGTVGGCTVIVGSVVTFSGNSDMQIECEDNGVTTPKAPGNVALAG